MDAQRVAVCRLPVRERAAAGVINAIFMSGNLDCRKTP
jgi:hypothetical protein